jgi:hypothetical protein
MVVLPVTCFNCKQDFPAQSPEVGSLYDCPHCRAGVVVTALPAPQPALSPGEVLFLSLGVAAAGATALYLGFKGYQYLTDEWVGAGPGSVEFSVPFKRELRAEHIRRYGPRCSSCRRTVRRRSHLHIDHKKTVRDGGGPYRSNAQVLCARCNLRKGGKSSAWEFAIGR